MGEKIPYQIIIRFWADIARAYHRPVLNRIYGYRNTSMALMVIPENSVCQSDAHERYALQKYMAYGRSRRVSKRAAVRPNAPPPAIPISINPAFVGVGKFAPLFEESSWIEACERYMSTNGNRVFLEELLRALRFTFG